jgi:hypothetical protein
VDPIGLDPLHVYVRRPSVSAARALLCAPISARIFPAASPGTLAQNEVQGPPGLLGGPPGLI